MMRSCTPTRLATCALLLIWVGSCARPQPKRLPPKPATWGGASADEGGRIFRAVCAGCHGADGRARTPVADVMQPRPRDLTLGEYRFRSTTDDVLPLRTDILRTLRRGLAGTQMPGWSKQLSDQELMSVVLYLETLSPRFQEEDPPEEDDVIVDLNTVRAPPVTPELLARGRKVFENMKCWECHGKGGRGDGPSVPTLKNRDGLPADIFDFTYGRYKGGTLPVAVYRTFLTGLDGTPMPSYNDTLTEEADRWALVYYCLSLGRGRGVWFYLTDRPTWEEPMTE